MRRAWVVTAPLMASLAAAAPVNVEVWYGPMCSHCMFFLSQMLPALFEARLPGDQVALTLLPYALNDQGLLPAPDQCDSTDAPCHYLPAPLCALQAIPQPSRIDSGDLYNAYQFMICDLAHANAGSPVPQTEQSIQGCAFNAKIDTPQWQDCVTAKRRDEGFQQKAQDLYGRLRAFPDMMAPFIFINGEALQCDDPHTCTATRSASGETHPVPVTGDLAQVVCSMLPAPVPAGCMNPMRKFEASAMHRLLPEAQGLPRTAPVATALAALVGCLVALVGLAVGRRRASDQLAMGPGECSDRELYAPCVTQAASDSTSA